MKIVGVIVGLFLLFFGTLIFLFALPSLSDVTKTGPYTIWENSSSFTITAIQMTNEIVVFLPFLFFFLGIAMLIYSIGGS